MLLGGGEGGGGGARVRGKPVGRLAERPIQKIFNITAAVKVIFHAK